jgi:hypothetical protein
LNDKDSIIIRIEYDLKGLRTFAYGDISEVKLDEFLSGKENFIGITNNKELIWIAKDAIFKIEQLQEDDIKFERNNSQIHCENSPTECLEF